MRRTKYPSMRTADGRDIATGDRGWLLRETGPLPVVVVRIEKYRRKVTVQFDNGVEQTISMTSLYWQERSIWATEKSVKAAYVRRAKEQLASSRQSLRSVQNDIRERERKLVKARNWST